MSEVWIEVVRGRDGSTCVCISDESGSGRRVGGGKPWGGGTTIHRWKVYPSETVQAIWAAAERDALKETP